MPDEVVYVLGTPGSNTVKIGRTTDLAKRVAAIQRMSPVPLSVLWTTPGSHDLETRLHRHFSHCRTHGEWFAFRTHAVKLIQWAVEDEPWLRPKVDLKKAALQNHAAATPLRLPLSQGSEGQCLWCGRPVPEQKGAGRRRGYCRRSCRQRAYESRQQRQAVAEASAQIVSSIAAIPDLAERRLELDRIEGLVKQELRQARAKAVLELKEEGRTWREVGQLLGVTGARAEQMSRGAR